MTAGETAEEDGIRRHPEGSRRQQDRRHQGRPRSDQPGAEGEAKAKVDRLLHVILEAAAKDAANDVKNGLKKPARRLRY